MGTVLSAAGAPAQPESFPALRRLLEAVEDQTNRTEEVTAR
jgi:hypothetical protein